MNALNRLDFMSEFFIRIAQHKFEFVSRPAQPEEYVDLEGIIGKNSISIFWSCTVCSFSILNIDI